MTIKQLEKITKKASDELLQAKDQRDLEKLRIKYLGRKSELTRILRSIKNLPQKKRPIMGAKANEIRKRIEDLYNDATEKMKISKALDKDEEIDVTIPVKAQAIGHIHPITQMLWRAEEIFQKMGFEIFEPFEIDDDYHNFESVNIPPGHPARDLWDTFWTEDGFIPITHTSSMQVRILKSRKPPIRAVVPGKVFRNERTDPRHEHTLSQIEGIYVDKGISLSDMIGTLKTFFDAFYGKDVQVKVVPDYFPFVEPGNGMNLSCVICDMKGCRVCKHTGWLEILGCGMIHPNVLREGGIDPDVYSGFAWGFGLDRLVMLKYGIEDIRHFRNGDLRFIRQF
ncbi:phenylalanine--tRNA ligase subunit alpha [Candidatus Dojkabacteria bacterium]|nr:phenylalanine--tRNA ligase subunit alpha [Candidatus Dojkabacteria bacterium]